MVLAIAVAGFCTNSPVRGANVNAAFISHESSLNETNPVFPGPVGGTLTLGFFGDIDNNAGTPDAFAAFLPGATPAGDHDNQLAGNPAMQGFHKENTHDIPAITVNTSGLPTSIFTFNIDPDQIVMHPGNTGANAIVPPFFDAVVRYTAARPGNYDITGSFDSIDVGSTLNQVLLNETTVLFSQNESLGQPAAFSLTNVALAAGDRVDFIVDPNGNVFGDTTGLVADIVVPEPGALALLCGVGAITFRSRRQRRRTDSAHASAAQTIPSSRASASFAVNVIE
jgi:hypothetical protein